MKKFAMIAWIFMVAVLCTYLVTQLFRSYIVGGFVFFVFMVLLAVTWIMEKRKEADAEFITKKTVQPQKVKKAPPRGIDQFTDSIIIDKRVRGAVIVGIKMKAVKEFEQECPGDIKNIPVYMACKAINAPERQIPRILEAKDSYTLQEIKASDRTPTSKWGKEKIYFMQINADYLK